MGNMPAEKGNKPPNKVDLPESHSDSARPVSRKSDLASLFGSETRAVVLWTLLNHPDRGLTQAEFAHVTGRDPKDVQRALDILVQLDLAICMRSLGGEPCHISPYVDGRLDPVEAVKQSVEQRIRTYGFSRRYWLNKDHPWIPGLKIILENSSLGAIHLLQEELRAFPVGKPEPDVAFVYGSFAVGEQTPQSDIDLIVIGCHDRETLADIIDGLEQRIAHSVNYVEYTCEEWAMALKEDIDFARSIMTKPKVFLIGDNEKLGHISEARTCD
jgi:predicted nucleotidyltransferase